MISPRWTITAPQPHHTTTPTTSHAPQTVTERRGPQRVGVVSLVGNQKGASSSEPPLPPESLIITCEGGLVIFLIIPHFISIPPFQTEREKLIASKIHLYNLPPGP